MKTGAIILAAGSSSRMSGDKQLLIYKEKSLLHTVMDQVLTLELDKIICVTGHLHEKLHKMRTHKTLEWIRNENPEKGMTSSLQKGLSRINVENDMEAILVVLSDQPLIPTTYYQSLVKYGAATSKAIIASGYQGTFGAPVLYKKEYFEHLENLDQAVSPKKLIYENLSDLLVLSCEAAAIDIDTDADYRRLNQ